MFGTDIQPKSEVQYRNQYLIYDPNFKSDELRESTTEEKTDLTDKKEDIKKTEKSADSEDLNKTFKKRGKGNIKLNRLASISIDKSPVSKEERDWFKRSFPNIKLEEIQGLIENEALGQFISSGKVLLSSEATVGTLYHEAFHTVTQLYLTKPEIKALYTEARIKLKRPKATDKQIEEILAEDFRVYKETGKILGERFHRNNIFRRLLKFIKDLLNMPANSIDEIYQRIDKGFYAKKDIVGINQFANDKLYNSLPNKSEAYTKELLDSIDAIFYDILFLNNGTPNQVFDNVIISSDITDGIFDKLNDLFPSSSGVSIFIKAVKK